MKAVWSCDLLETKMFSGYFNFLYMWCISVTMDDFCPSLVIQVSPHPTPAEIIIITVGKRNGIFQVSLGNGEGALSV